MTGCLRECLTDQLVSDLVHHVGVVEPPPLVLPPAFDVHTRFLFKVGQVEIIPVQKKHKILCLCRKKKKKRLFWDSFVFDTVWVSVCTLDLSVMTGFIRGVQETDASSASSSASSSLEFWMSSLSSSSFSPSFFFLLADEGLLTPSIWLP